MKPESCADCKYWDMIWDENDFRICLEKKAKLEKDWTETRPSWCPLDNPVVCGISCDHYFDKGDEKNWRMIPYCKLTNKQLHNDTTPPKWCPKLKGDF